MSLKHRILSSPLTNRIFSVLPQIFDVLLFVFAITALYLKDSSSLFVNTYMYYFVLAFPCVFMIGGVCSQAYRSFKEKTIYSLTMIYAATQLKVDYQTRVPRDFIIYSLHIALAALLMDPFYAFAVFACIVYDGLLYNAAFNPRMVDYIMRTSLKKVEDIKNASN